MRRWWREYYRCRSTGCEVVCSVVEVEVVAWDRECGDSARGVADGGGNRGHFRRATTSGHALPPCELCENVDKVDVESRGPKQTPLHGKSHVRTLAFHHHEDRRPRSRRHRRLGVRSAPGHEVRRRCKNPEVGNQRRCGEGPRHGSSAIGGGLRRASSPTGGETSTRRRCGRPATPVARRTVHTLTTPPPPPPPSRLAAPQVADRPLLHRGRRAGGRCPRRRGAGRGGRRGPVRRRDHQLRPAPRVSRRAGVLARSALARCRRCSGPLRMLSNGGSMLETRPCLHYNRSTHHVLDPCPWAPCANPPLASTLTSASLILILYSPRAQWAEVGAFQKYKNLEDSIAYGWMKQRVRATCQAGCAPCDAMRCDAMRCDAMRCDAMPRRPWAPLRPCTCGRKRARGPTLLPPAARRPTSKPRPHRRTSATTPLHPTPRPRSHPLTPAHARSRCSSHPPPRRAARGVPGPGGARAAGGEVQDPSGHA